MTMGSLVALVDFVTFDGEEMFAGISRVSAGHVYLLRHPEEFGPDGRAAKSKTFAAERTRTAAAASSQPRQPRPAKRSAPKRRTLDDPPEIRKGYRLDVPTVRFDAHATRRLDGQPFGADREYGGGLYGWAEGSDILVIDVCANAEISGRSNDSLWLDIDEMIEFAKRTRCDWIGSWHTHRDFREDGPKPSLPDRASWSGCFEDYCSSRYKPSFIGMILAPSGPETTSVSQPDRWFPPARAAWVVRSEGDETVIETAKLKFEYEYEW